MIATDMLVLAAENPLTSSALFGTVQSFFRVVGGIVVIAGIWTVAKSAIAGQIPQAIKKAIGAFLVAALLFNITIPINLASGLGGLVSRVGELIQGVVDGEEPTVSGARSSSRVGGETTVGSTRSSSSFNTSSSVGGPEVGCDYPFNPGC